MSRSVRGYKPLRRCIGPLLCLWLPLSAVAQIPIGQGAIPGDRPSAERLEPPLVEPQEEPRPVLPPYRPRRQPELPNPADDVRVLAREIRVTGNSALSSDLLGEIARAYEGRELAYADLAALRDELTQAYVDRGYVTSGATLPNQTIRDGIVEVRIIEGRLQDVEIQTDGRFRPSYIRSRLRDRPGAPVNVFELEQQLQLLQRDARMQRVQAQLLPSERRGLSILRIAVREASPLRVGAEFNNTRAPGLGSLGGAVHAAFDNLIGIGDELFARYEGSQGLSQIEATVSVPITVYDTLFSFRYQRSWADIVDDDFNRLDIETDSETFGIELRQPLYRDLNTTLETFVRAERRRADSELGILGIGLPVPGAPDGKTDVSVLRFALEGRYSGRNQVLAGRAFLNWGIDALNSTTNSGNTPDSRFLSGLLQLQWATRLPWLGAELVARYDMQLTNDRLLTLEQFAIGGRYTVRGYRENQLVRDNGVLGSAELRVPVFQRIQPRLRLELVPFFDAGHTWTRGRRDRGQQTLMSAGIGTRMLLTDWGFAELFWGHRFEDVSRIGQRDLQDDGIHFRIGVSWP